MSNDTLVEEIKESLVTETDLTFLRQLDTETLEKIHKELHDYIARTEELQKPVFKVMAVSTQFIPNFIIAKLAHDYLTPYIIAQVVIYMDPKAAAKIGKSLRIDYMGQVAIYANPEITARIGNLMEPPLVTQVVKDLAQKNFFGKLGELADLLDDKVMIDIIKNLREGKMVGNIAHAMMNQEKLIRIIPHIPPEIRSGAKAQLMSLGNKIAERF
ncbi:MAG: hypothetical protein JSR44_02500 [Spirochaetes bacterium]|nr:hypothetical protein [Spirochaetota bacterium]